MRTRLPKNSILKRVNERAALISLNEHKKECRKVSESKHWSQFIQRIEKKVVVELKCTTNDEIAFYEVDENCGIPSMYMVGQVTARGKKIRVGDFVVVLATGSPFWVGKVIKLRECTITIHRANGNGESRSQIKVCSMVAKLQV